MLFSHGEVNFISYHLNFTSKVDEAELAPVNISSIKLMAVINTGIQN